jgi:hypothetical protein
LTCFIFERGGFFVEGCSRGRVGTGTTRQQIAIKKRAEVKIGFSLREEPPRHLSTPPLRCSNLKRELRWAKEVVKMVWGLGEREMVEIRWRVLELFESEFFS